MTSPSYIPTLLASLEIRQDLIDRITLLNPVYIKICGGILSGQSYSTEIYLEGKIEQPDHTFINWAINTRSKVISVGNLGTLPVVSKSDDLCSILEGSVSALHSYIHDSQQVLETFYVSLYAEFACRLAHTKSTIGQHIQEIFDNITEVTYHPLRLGDSRVDLIYPISVKGTRKAISFVRVFIDQCDKDGMRLLAIK